MALVFSRKQTTVLGYWWWTVDRWLVMALMAIMAIGVVVSFSASPAVANKLNLGTFFFVKRHLLILPVAIAVMVGVSLLSVRSIRRCAVIGFAVGIVLLILTLLIGVETKGARRWLMIAGMSLQASEIIKPSLVVLCAWMLAQGHKEKDFPGVWISAALVGVVLVLLMLQPDLGMSVLTAMIWVVQLFIAGIPLIWMAGMLGVGVAALVGAYYMFPHVTKRVDQFMFPETVDVRNELYQVHKSLEAFRQGGVFGRGPGEGKIKTHVPDAQADFVFSVLGEEFGFAFCLLLVALFLFVVVRSLIRSQVNASLFSMLTVAGLAVHFGMQALINMSSALHIIPTKGMTLPFVSYGGSSLIALGMAMGGLLALTRKRHGSEYDL